MSRPPTRHPTLYTPISRAGRHTAQERVGTTKAHGKGRLVTSTHPKHPLKPRPVIRHQTVVKAQRRERQRAARNLSHANPSGGPFSGESNPLDALGYHRYPTFKRSPAGRAGQRLVRSFNRGAKIASGEGAPKVSGIQRVGPVVIPSASARSPLGSKLAQNAVKDALQLAANTPAAAYNTAAAGFEAAQGDTKRAKQLAEGFINNDPLALAVQGRFKDAGKVAYEHPTSTVLELMGGKAAIGRTAGRVQRAAGASREAAPAVLEGTRVTKRRPYSKDAVTRQRQIVVDRARMKRTQTLLRKAADAERRGAHDEQVRYVHQARAASPFHVSDKEVQRRVDERNAANEDVRRTLRSLAIKRASKHVIAENRGGHLVSLLAQGIVHPHRADIEAYIRELDHHYRSGVLTHAQRAANRKLAKNLRAALNSSHLDLAKLHSAARTYAREQAQVEAGLVKAHLLDGQQAEKARLIPYAVRRMGAHHDGDRIVAPNGNVLSSAEIKAHMRRHGVDPDEIAYLPQGPNARGVKNFYMSALQRHTIPNQHRTGDATRYGTFDSHPLTLVEQASREANLLAADHGFKAYIDEFAIRRHTGPEAGKVLTFQTKRSADLYIRDQHAQGSRALRAVRANPFLGKQKDLQSVIDHADATSTVHPDVTTAIQQAVKGEDGTGPWVIVHDVGAARVNSHLRLQGLEGLRGLRTVNQAFRNTVLPLSTKWVTGNVVEAGFRTAVAGAGPLSYLTGRRIFGGERHGIVARPGKRVPKGIGLKPFEGAIDRELTPAQAMEARARIMGGGHFAMNDRSLVHVDSTQFENTILRPIAHALGTVARSPGPAQVGGLWQLYTHFVFSENGLLERRFMRTLAGKYAREVMPPARGLRLGRTAIEQAARGLRDTNEQAEWGRFVDRAYGAYGKFSPRDRALIAYYTPFIAWSLNAVRFVGSVLPKDHPVLTGLMAAAQNASEDWLKDHRLVKFIDSAAPGWLQGSIPTGGGFVRASRFLPFGFFSDPAQSVASVAMPQYAGAFMALNGLDWKGDPLNGLGGAEPQDGDKFGAALDAFLGGTIPVLSQVEQVSSKDGPVGQRLLRQFDPFYPVKNTEDDSTNSSGWGTTNGWGAPSKAWGK